MKQIIRILPGIFFLFIAIQSQAQMASLTKIEVKTSAVCSSCKKTIETAVKKVDGVSKVNVNNDTKIATIEFDSEKTTVDIIKHAINTVGYDADDSKALKETYDTLDMCCKKKE